MEATSLLNLVTHWARSQPEREVLVTPEARLSYADLATRILRTAEALQAAGFRPGARLAFLGRPGAAFLISQLAAQACGGCWLGLNPRYTAAELGHVLNDAQPALLTVESEADAPVALAALAQLRAPPRLQVLAKLDDLRLLDGALNAPQKPLPSEIALLVYTSGTTGKPKGAMLTHRGVMEASRLYAARYGHAGMRTLLNLPINHVGALVDLVTPALRTGGAIVTQPGFEPSAIPEILSREAVTVLGQVPAMHLAIEVAGGYDPEALPALRHLVWSGAAMPRSWITARHGGRVELSTCYGLTECTGSVTFSRPDADIDTLAQTVGRPAEPGALRVRAADGRAVEPGDVGEVQVRGPLVMAGYLNAPDATVEAIDAEGWLSTGDLGRLTDTGDLVLVGRSREMFKSGGYNVYPREVEVVLEDHPSVAGAAVISIPDPLWQEVGWAFVLKRGLVSPEELKTHVRARLANYKVPKRFILADELPLLPIGKIDKQALRARALAAVRDAQ